VPSVTPRCPQLRYATATTTATGSHVFCPHPVCCGELQRRQGIAPPQANPHGTTARGSRTSVRTRTNDSGSRVRPSRLRLRRLTWPFVCVSDRLRETGADPGTTTRRGPWNRPRTDPARRQQNAAAAHAKARCAAEWIPGGFRFLLSGDESQDRMEGDRRAD
jgi:hypothetical protein